MENKTYGIILFIVALVYYIFLNIFVKSVSPTTQIILYVIWILIIWTFIFWIFRNIEFFKNLSSKLETLQIFKYAGYFVFLIFSINATFALFQYEESRAWIAFWSYMFSAIISIPIIYFLGWLFSKIEKNKWFSRRAVELQTGLSFGILLTLVYWIIGILAISLGPLVSPESFPKSFTSYLSEGVWGTIMMFIISFILGFITGFIIRIYNKVFTRTSRLFEKK